MSNRLDKLNFISERQIAIIETLLAAIKRMDGLDAKFLIVT